MIGVKEICALLAAGGMGASGVVAVQQVKPARAVHAKAKPAPQVRKASAPRAQPRLSDCPVATASLGGGSIANLAPITPFEQTPMASISAPQSILAGGPGGTFAPAPPFNGGSGGNTIPGGGFTPGVPEPAAWAMMVSGFGLVGVAMRRSGSQDSAQG
jgi:PEP-CTERM motif